VNAEHVRNRLLVDGRVVATFRHPITQSFYLERSDVLVVLTHSRNWEGNHRNLWAFRGNGRRRWRVGASGFRTRAGTDPVEDVGPYDDDYLLARMGGDVAAIHALTGGVVPLRRRLIW
jgi:hypothetical protein